MPLLAIKNLSIQFGAGPGVATVVEDLSLEIAAGETVALVGESGCGKSITALSIARLVPSPPAIYKAGQILVEGQDVLKMAEPRLRQIRGGTVSYIFQEPGAALNPVMKIGAQIREILKLHRPQANTVQEAMRLLESVGIPAPETRLRQYAHELSGGTQQRVMIAMALASRPKLLVADEPTTALDATIQAQILELLRELRQRLGMSLLLITSVSCMPAKSLNTARPTNCSASRCIPTPEDCSSRLPGWAGMWIPCAPFPARSRGAPRCPPDAASIPVARWRERIAPRHHPS
jgi:ABC-type dipeptide/oligopeptide/nickel transport system ATPase component